MTSLAFLDTETTGVDPDLHQVWEVAYVLAEHDPDGRTLTVERTDRMLVADVDLDHADPMALQIGGFWQRWHPQSNDPALCTSDVVAREVARATAGRHLVGAVPSFDAAFLTRMLRDHGSPPAWHYHLIDVEPLVAGYLAFERRAGHTDFDAAPPWRSTDLAEAVGVTIDVEDRHTALGDAIWALRQYVVVYELEIIDEKGVLS